MIYVIQASSWRVFTEVLTQYVAQISPALPSTLTYLHNRRLSVGDRPSFPSQVFNQVESPTRTYACSLFENSVVLPSCC